MEDRAIDVVALAEVLKDLRAELIAAGITVSEPQPRDSPADALNSPISAEDVRQVFEVLTAVLQTGAAVLKFREALRKAVRRHGSTATLQDARNGESLGRVSPDLEEVVGLDDE